MSSDGKDVGEMADGMEGEVAMAVAIGEQEVGEVGVEVGEEAGWEVGGDVWLKFTAVEKAHRVPTGRGSHCSTSSTCPGYKRLLGHSPGMCSGGQRTLGASGGCVGGRDRVFNTHNKKEG